ncbi:hypothetical protein AOT81_03395 [Xylella fastidiosa]|nr:hypothetical protein AOT81_03395 [Xylella fastidiosa]RWA44138.1 hypothetical protein XfCFBP8356_07720 [Xylella fastidiosa subsp. sandyi]
MGAGDADSVRMLTVFWGKMLRVCHVRLRCNVPCLIGISDEGSAAGLLELRFPVWPVIASLGIG